MLRNIDLYELKEMIFSQNFNDLQNCDLSKIKFSEKCGCCSTCLCPIGATVYITGTNLRGAKLPDPKEMLLCNWGGLSNNLTQLCMAYDASLHPNPKKFDNWATGDGSCPYLNCQNLRSVWFVQKRSLWDSKIKPPTAYDLMVMLIREKCVDSDFHDHTELQP